MAIHDSIVSLLRESLTEYLHVAEYCINFRKDVAWGKDQVGGCLGYPGATIMFCIVDTIGSYHRKRKDFMVRVDGKDRQITNNSFHHFFVFNSDYYNQQLSEPIIKKLYDNYRSLLLHNAVLAIDHFLFMGNSDEPAFPVENGKPHVNVSAFLKVTKSAVHKFLARVDQIVPGSDQEKIIRLK
jgi:hypothetical protein